MPSITRLNWAKARAATAYTILTSVDLSKVAEKDLPAVLIAQSQAYALLALANAMLAVSDNDSI